MTGAAAGFERRVHDALEASPSRIPVVLGGCGTGRTWLLQHVADRVGADRVQYIAVERCATTPERFLHAVTAASPFTHAARGVEPGARKAFEALLAFFESARAPDGGPVLFLLDEVLELRTFESFPGLRHVVRELVDALAAGPNRFLLTTRYVARAHRLLRDAPARFEVMHVPPLEAGDVVDHLAPVFGGYERMATDDRDYLGRAVQALTAGRAVYVKAIGDALARQIARQAGVQHPDPVAALATLLAPDGALTSWCRYCYELRLHRARGYGALKAILDILAEEESLTLTEISQRLRRTPGSTKDYLSWLEDVDLVVARQKRYSYTDPVLRLWNRLHCRPAEPSGAEIVRAVQLYALSRVPLRETVPALAYAGVEATPEERKSWGIIEID